METAQLEVGSSGWKGTAHCAVFGAPPGGPWKSKGPSAAHARSYSPHQVSKVNSLWTMEQCRQRKSAKWIHNSRKIIGFEGWARGPILEPIGCRRTARTAPMTRATRMKKIGILYHNSKFFSSSNEVRSAHYFCWLRFILPFLLYFVDFLYAYIYFVFVHIILQKRKVW